MTLAEIFEKLPYGPAPEAADLANAWLDARGRKFGHFIGGQFMPPKKGVYFETLNPATAQPIAKVAQGGQSDVDAAVKAAKKAQEGWWEMGCHERAKRLYALARQVQKHSRLLAVLETLDNGKPIRETRDIDIPLVARHFTYHAGWAQLMEAEMAGFEPVGVCGQIIPWNFPLLMLAWKIAPALSMGNAVVLKPAEFTPLTALCFAELCQAAGIPPGVVNIVTGDGETGRLLVEHPLTDKIAFTGSTEVGRLIRRATAGTGKKLSLELGGKSPFVVFEDADLGSAIEGLVDAIWFNQGQVCCAGSRLLLQESVADVFLPKLRARMENLRVGDPLDKAVDIGAIIAPVQLERIGTLVDKGREEGAEIFQPSWACPKDGWFYPPTLLTNVSPASTVAQVEIFGPVLVSMTFRTPAEAVALANNTTYGLAASVWSENLSLALDVAGKIKAGTVWVNSTNLFDAASGFGGYRESGFGREGGKEGLFEYAVKAERRPSGSKEIPQITAESGADEGSIPRFLAYDAFLTADARFKTRGRPTKMADRDYRARLRDLVLERRTAKEIADTLKVPLRTAEAHIAIAKKELRGATQSSSSAAVDPQLSLPDLRFAGTPIDRTYKLYIGGKQVRPDQGYSVEVLSPRKEKIGEVGRGNRKDIRNAVEAAKNAQIGWSEQTAHSRAQVLFYLAENLLQRREDFARLIAAMDGSSAQVAFAEIDTCARRLFDCAAWADKHEGLVHGTAFRGITYTLNEPLGAIGIVCPNEPSLLPLITLAGAALAMGNAVVAVPSETKPLAAMELYHVLEGSDVPPGVLNLVSGVHEELEKTLAEHDGLDAVWHFGPKEGASRTEMLSVGNLKQTWRAPKEGVDWFAEPWGDGEEFMRHATQVKNIWAPIGE